VVILIVDHEKKIFLLLLTILAALGPSFSTKMSRRFRRHQRCFYVLKAPKKASKTSRLFCRKIGPKTNPGQRPKHHFCCGDMGIKLNIINAEIWENNAEI
jgi:hypothetical protein